MAAVTLSAYTATSRSVREAGGARDGTGGKRLDGVGAEPGGHDDGAVGHAADGRGQPDRHLQVRPRDGELVAAQRQVQPLEHRQGAGATGRRAAGGGQGLGKDVALTSELHGRVTPVGRFGSLDPPPGLSPLS